MFRNSFLAFLLCVPIALSAFPAAAQNQEGSPSEEIAWGKEEDGLRAGLLVEPRILKAGGVVAAVFVLINDSKETKSVPKPGTGLINWMFTNSNDELTASMSSAAKPNKKSDTVSLRPGQSIRVSENLTLHKEHLPEGSKRGRVKALFSPLGLSSGTVDILVND